MINLRLAFALLAATAVTPAYAATIHAVSKVDAVTVFPSGAEVTRIAEATIAQANMRWCSKDCRAT